jgi:NAD(P)H-flavin reductase
MPEAEKSVQHWQGETGFIRPDMLKRYLSDLKTPRYYFAGPPGMTTAMRSMLLGIGIAEPDMLSEEFFGY